MSDYYIDGTISSVSGTGSGTLADPWGKDNDLLDFAMNEVSSGVGIGADGDAFIVVDGDLTNTGSLDFTGYSLTIPFVLRPLVMDGSQRVGYDAGAVTLHPSTVISGLNFYFLDFTNLPTSGTFLDINGRCTIAGCSFDGAGKTDGTFVNCGSNGVLVGNHWFNDNRTTGGLLLLASAGSIIQGNFFEGITGSFYDMYTYSSALTNNIFTYSSSYSYSVGSVLPIDFGKFVNNTFLGPGCFGASNNGASCVFVSNNYEGQDMRNNYFEGWNKCVNVASASTSPYLIYASCGNRYFNCGEFYETGMPDESVILNRENEELSSSGLVDIAGGDFRPNNLLINQGYDPFAMTGAVQNTLRPTVGALENNIVVPRIRDIY